MVEAGPPDPMSGAESVFDSLMEAAHLAAPHELPALIAAHCSGLGGSEALIYLADLQQSVLVPFTGSAAPDLEHEIEVLSIDATLAGRVFRTLDVHVQDVGGGRGERVWLPVLNGTERLGVLRVRVPGGGALSAHDALLERRLRRLAAVVAELVMTKTLYADTIVRVRRQVPMSLAAEVQWALLPPLTFASRDLVVAAALEPAYEVAGDSVDYAVNEGSASFASFDAMGHGLRSAQLVALAVAAYRNGRRAGRTLSQTAREIDSAVLELYRGRMFVTAVLAELDTETGLLRWICAGHPRPLLLRDGQVIRRLDEPAGVPFGVDAGADATERGVGTVQLQPGDRLVLHTDGLTEARAPDGSFFGADRLVDLLTRNSDPALPPPETVRRVVRDLMTHQQGHLQDDATLVVAEWRGSSQRSLLPGSARIANAGTST